MEEHVVGSWTMVVDRVSDVPGSTTSTLSSPKSCGLCIINFSSVKRRFLVFLLNILPVSSRMMYDLGVSAFFITCAIDSQPLRLFSLLFSPKFKTGAAS